MHLIYSDRQSCKDTKPKVRCGASRRLMLFEHFWDGGDRYRDRHFY
jgi:hypothetical protein